MARKSRKHTELAVSVSKDSVGYIRLFTFRSNMDQEDIVTLVDVDFAEYRKRVDQRAVKKNCTIPYWMSVEADKAGINYSRVLQEALSKILGKPQKIIN